MRDDTQAFTAFLATMGVMALIVIAAGCNRAPVDEVAPDTSVRYIHDDIHAVSCWTFGLAGGSNTASISCLPDRDVRNP